jgi:hypothetical protein
MRSSSGTEREGRSAANLSATALARSSGDTERRYLGRSTVRAREIVQQRMAGHQRESFLGRNVMSSAAGTAEHMKISVAIFRFSATTMERSCPGMSIGSPCSSECDNQNQPPVKSAPAQNPQISALLPLESFTA